MNYSKMYENGASPEIGNNCKLSKTIELDRFVKIGNGCSIGDNVKIGFNTRIGNNVSIEEEVVIGNNTKIYDNVTIRSHTMIEDNVEIGYDKLSRKKSYYEDYNTHIGNNCIIRSGAVIYKSCRVGDRSWIGNYSVIRENTLIGNDTTFGSHIMCEGYSSFGNNTKIYSFCELGGNMEVEDNVFIGPGTVTANNPKPLISTDEKPTTRRWDDGINKVVDKGPTIRHGARIGIGSILLAEIEIGRGALVAAGSVVTKNVSENTTVKGVPAK